MTRHPSWSADRPFLLLLAALALLALAGYVSDPWFGAGSAHMEPVTQRENLLRGETIVGINARKTRCMRGHEFTFKNTYRTAKGHRTCRTCYNASMRAWKARRRAAA